MTVEDPVDLNENRQKIQEEIVEIIKELLDLTAKDRMVSIQTKPFETLRIQVPYKPLIQRRLLRRLKGLVWVAANDRQLSQLPLVRELKLRQRAIEYIFKASR